MHLFHCFQNNSSTWDKGAPTVTQRVSRRMLAQVWFRLRFTVTSSQTLTLRLLSQTATLRRASRLRQLGVGGWEAKRSPKPPKPLGMCMPKHGVRCASPNQNKRPVKRSRPVGHPKCPSEKKEEKQLARRTLRKKSMWTGKSHSPVGMDAARNPSG